MPSHGMDTAAILKNIGYSEADIKELVGKGLATVSGIKRDALIGFPVSAHA